MVALPPELIRRLSLPDAHALRRALGVVEELLPVVYAEGVAHQRPRDNANIFGLRVSTHLWTALAEPVYRARLGIATIVERNHAKSLNAGGMAVAIHKVGHLATDDIHNAFPEGSPTQRGYGERNAGQLSLFESTAEAPLPAERAFALRDLVVGHFGNAQDGLAKWYVGAFVYDRDGRPRWAWVTRQPAPVGATAVEPPNDITAYDQREPAALDIPPRRSVGRDTSSDNTTGA
jgi:hypothetical protein